MEGESIKTLLVKRDVLAGTVCGLAGRDMAARANRFPWDPEVKRNPSSTAGKKHIRLPVAEPDRKASSVFLPQPRMGGNSFN
jgi:hypothetical protein